MKAKQHAKVWRDIAEKLQMISDNEAGQDQRRFAALSTFAEVIAESYRESDNARG